MQVMTIHSSSSLRKNLNPHDVVVVQCNTTHDTTTVEESRAHNNGTGTDCRLQELNREKEERAVAINPLLQTPFNFADKKWGNRIAIFFSCALLAVYPTGNRGLRMRENESVCLFLGRDGGDFKCRGACRKRQPCVSHSHRVKKRDFFPPPLPLLVSATLPDKFVRSSVSLPLSHFYAEAHLYTPTVHIAVILTLF